MCKVSISRCVKKGGGGSSPSLQIVFAHIRFIHTSSGSFFRGGGRGGGGGGGVLCPAPICCTVPPELLTIIRVFEIILL